MTAAAGRGDKAGVATAFQRCVEMLEKEVGVEPSEETTALYEKILAGKVPPDAEPAGSIEGYELKEEIGAGAHGSVYLAYQRSVGREVAVKSILPQYANDPEFIGRFESEAQRIAHLEHPNIVPLYDFWRGPEGAYLVMRLLRGGTLLSSLADGPWPVERALRMLEQVASALAAAHRQGIIHRDVKASNILLDEEGNAYLSDFGIAKDLTHAGLTAVGALIGTPEYISPEQIRDEDLSPQTDIYSLGVVLYETLTGDKPFTAVTLSALLLKQLNEPLPPITDRRPDLPPQVNLVIQRATAKKSADRFPDAPAMAIALGRAIGGVQGEAEWARNDEQVKNGLVQQRQSEISFSPPAFLRETSEPMAIPMETFIGRESELSRLDQLLAQSIAGKGQLALLTGEAGRGKTSLLSQFARRALDAQPALIVASGTCSIFTGIGDPYLPFREVLGMLSGDIKTQLATGTISRDNALRLWHFQFDAVQTLVDFGPHLIDTFVTARALQDRVARYAPDQAGLLDDFRKVIDHRSAFGSEQDSNQSRIFEEYWDVLAALAARQPLLIILDDLHWADDSSISLLSYLARRVAESPVMLLGAYRPEDVALDREGRRHPLADVLSELKRRLGNIWIDLDRDAQTLGRNFVDGLLDTEPNRLGETFREKLLTHTGGHPLFTVELLRDMQARGRLQKDGTGQWVEDSKLSWEELPAKVEGVIETRIRRLDAVQQEILSVASVEGEEFAAEVIARVLARDGREMAQRLSGDLERQHRLVQEQGIRYAGTHRLSLFRFRHNLFRNYLYDRLGDPERMYLHEAIGNSLEELHQDQAEELAAIAPQLAHHFQEARMAKKAVNYSLLAGEQASRSFAYEEAISHFKRGLALMSELPDSSRQSQQEFDLLLSLGQAQWKLGSVAEALDTLERSARVARGLASSEALAQAALAYEEPRWRFNLPPDPVVRLLEDGLEA
jgi:serine/threonine protein kinase/tetratricopeptide (TPR) repeat protein